MENDTSVFVTVSRLSCGYCLQEILEQFQVRVFCGEFENRREKKKKQRVQRLILRNV